VTVPVAYKTPRPTQRPSAPRFRPFAYRQSCGRNPNYRHGRACRYRWRLEHRVTVSYSHLESYRWEAPAYLPYRSPQDWPRVPLGALPRAAFALAIALDYLAWTLWGYFLRWRAEQWATLPFPVLMALALALDPVQRRLEALKAAPI
jgi:hypothetical protein